MVGLIPWGIFIEEDEIKKDNKQISDGNIIELTKEDYVISE